MIVVDFSSADVSQLDWLAFVTFQGMAYCGFLLYRPNNIAQNDNVILTN